MRIGSQVQNRIHPWIMIIANVLGAHELIINQDLGIFDGWSGAQLRIIAHMSVQTHRVTNITCRAMHVCNCLLKGNHQVRCGNNHPSCDMYRTWWYVCFPQVLPINAAYLKRLAKRLNVCNSIWRKKNKYPPVNCHIASWKITIFQR